MIRSGRRLFPAFRVAASQLSSAQQTAQPFIPAYAAYSAAPERTTANVPEGHWGSDLTDVTCNIGLNRRRDLTLRQDLSLFKQQSSFSLADVFKGSNVLLIGFPGGPICTEQHIPGYIELMSNLKQKGVEKVVCVSVGDPEELQKATGALSSDKLEIYADRNGSFVRLLGLELGTIDCGKGPKCQRFAAIVEDGILLKLKVEAGPADLKVTDAKSMLELWRDVYDC